MQRDTSGIESNSASVPGRTRSLAGPSHNIHRVPRRLSQQDAADLLGGLGAELGIALDTVKRRVGGEEDPGVLLKAFVVKRLLLDHVEPGAGDVARVEGFEQSGLVDDRATRRVDEDRARAHSRDGPALMRWRLAASR